MEKVYSQVILVDIPAFAVFRRVGVDNSHASKIGGSEKGRRVGRITNELGVVVGNDGGRDDVGTEERVSIVAEEGTEVRTLEGSKRGPGCGRGNTGGGTATVSIGDGFAIVQ